MAVVSFDRLLQGESQHAMVAAKLETLKQGRPGKDANLHDSVSRVDAAEMLNVRTRTVAAADNVRNDAPKAIVQAVAQGTVSLSLAAQAVALPEPEK